MTIGMLKIGTIKQTEMRERGAKKGRERERGAFESAKKIVPVTASASATAISRKLWQQN